jgi:glycerol-3-phosphate dehydrogenase (NAD+)
MSAGCVEADYQFEGKKLTEVINETHINKKYLPDVNLGDNVVAVPDIVKAVKGATALVFVMPHQCAFQITYLS